MDLINKTVTHQSYGKGTICELCDNIISVQFSSCVKKFIFPDAFRSFLEFKDNKNNKHVDGILHKIDDEKKLKREKEMREEKKRKKLSSLPIHVKSQVAFGFLENDKDGFLNNWELSSGTFRSGDNKGKPRIPVRVCPNTACLLTYCDKSKPEEDRLIWGITMVKEDFIGAESKDGLIPVHEKYRLILDKDEMNEFKFWNYFDSKTTKWGRVEIKYFANTIMARILKDLLTSRKGKENEQQCKKFLEYFCNCNSLNKHLIL